MLALLVLEIKTLLIDPTKFLSKKDSFSMLTKIIFSAVAAIFFVIISIVLSIIIQLIADRFGFNINDNYLPSTELMKLTWWQKVISVSIVAPIFEETAFRSWLTAKRYWVNCGFLVLFTLFLLSQVQFDVLLALLLLILWILILVTPTQIKSFLLKRMRLTVWLSSICFGLLHIQNYTNPTQFGPLLILLVLPQILIGFGLAYMRIRFGLRWSMLTHGLYNFIILLSLF